MQRPALNHTYKLVLRLGQHYPTAVVSQPTLSHLVWCYAIPHLTRRRRINSRSIAPPPPGKQEQILLKTNIRHGHVLLARAIHTSSHAASSRSTLSYPTAPSMPGLGSQNSKQTLMASSNNWGELLEFSQGLSNCTSYRKE